MPKYEVLSRELTERIRADRANHTTPAVAFADENVIRRRNLVKDKGSVWRPTFVHDIDKIMHCPYYNRYTDKTQVFSLCKNDDITRRSLHVQLVSRISRTIGTVLHLNLDLIEAIALGHDLGHTPFGHAGEDALTRCYDPDFAHYRQSLRVVEKLEKNGEGLNLCFEVRDAIVNHTGDSVAATPEGQLIKFADRIAYINHDIDDAIRAGILSPADLPKALTDVLGKTHGERINTMVMSVVEASVGRPVISMTPAVQEATGELRAFLFERVYRNPVAKAEETKAKEVVYALFTHYVTNPDKLPDRYKKRIGTAEGETVERSVADFISGMTDRYAIETYQERFVPRVWRGLHE